MVVRRGIRRFTRARGSESGEIPVGSFKRPIGIWAGTLFFRLFLGALGLPEQPAEILEVASGLLLTFAGVWAVYCFVDILCDYFESQAAKSDNKFDDMLVPLMRRTIKIVVVIGGILFLATKWTDDLWSIVAGLGLGSVAIAFAARDSVENLFGTFTVLLDKPFGIGDWIMMDDIDGSVESGTDTAVERDLDAFGPDDDFDPQIAFFRADIQSTASDQRFLGDKSEVEENLDRLFRQGISLQRPTKRDLARIPDQRLDQVARLGRVDFVTKTASSTEGEPEIFQLVRRYPGAVGQQIHAAIAHDRIAFVFEQFETIVDRSDRAEQIMANFRTQQSGQINFIIRHITRFQTMVTISRLFGLLHPCNQASSRQNGHKFPPDRRYAMPRHPRRSE